MAAGTQAYIIDQDYDPRTITLDQWLSMFEKESVEKGGREGNKTWGNLIRNNKITKQYLNQPVITLFGSVPSESQSIMADIQNAAGGQAGNIQSKFRVIESNIFPKLSTLGKKEGVDLLSGYTKITEDVKKIQTRGGKFTAKKGFNVNKIGELIKNLQEHVKEFPEDKPIANAILFNLENGSRPSLTTELRTVHYIKNQLGETGALMELAGRDGLLIPAGTKGVKRQAKGQAPNIQPYNAPLSKRGVTILQDQSDYNSKIIGDNKKLDFFFQVLDKDGNPRPITLTDINRVLETTTPFGMLFDYTNKGPKPSKTPITSKNLRNLFINSAALVIKKKENIAMLTNRDTASNTGSQEIYMGSPGQYKPEAINDLDQISRTNWGFFTLLDEDNKKVFTESGNMVNPNQFIFGKNEIDPETKTYIPDNVEYVKFGDSDPKEVPIQTKGFSPNLEEEEIIGERTTGAKQKTKAQEKDTRVLSFQDFDDEEINELRSIGIHDDNRPKSNQLTRIQRAKQKSDKLKSVNPFGLGLVGLTGAELLDNTGEIVAEEVTTSALGTAISKAAPKLAQTTAGKALPIAGAGFVFPSSPTNVDEIEGFARQDIDRRFGGIDQMDTSQEKQIYRDDPRLRGTTEMYDPSELPRRDPSDPLSDEAQRERFLARAREKASSGVRGFVTKATNR